MNEKLKRVVAIISLVLIGVFTVTLVLYLFDKEMLNGAIGDLAMWSGAFGILLAVVLWLSHAFPAQQVKDEQRKRLYDEAERAEADQEQSEQPEQEEAEEAEEQEQNQEDFLQPKDRD